MVEVTDILLDEGGAIIYNGDFLTGDASKQHQKHLLLTTKGAAKNHPRAGVGLLNYLNDETKPHVIESNIAADFERDGMRVNRIKFLSAEEIEINADYE